MDVCVVTSPRRPRHPPGPPYRDPYEDPYARDPYADPYYRNRYMPPLPPVYGHYDPYDPYEHPRPVPPTVRDPYFRDREPLPNATSDLYPRPSADMYERPSVDPYSRPLSSAYGRAPAGDPYARSSDIYGTRPTADPYARPPPEYYSRRGTSPPPAAARFVLFTVLCALSPFLFCWAIIMLWKVFFLFISILNFFLYFILFGADQVLAYVHVDVKSLCLFFYF